MDRQKLSRQLMETFVVELDEHVRSLNSALLAAEQRGGHVSPDDLAELQRVLHSLKGAARSVDVRIVEAACHRVEELLGRIRVGDLRLDAETLNLLFGVADALHDVGTRLRQGQDPALPGSPLETLLPALGARVAEATPSLGSVTASPAASGPAPVTGGYVRVSARKLDVLLNMSGELLTARRRLAQGQIDGDALAAEVQRARREWRRAHSVLAPAGAGDPDGPMGTMAGALTAIETHVENLLTRLRTQEQILDKMARSLDHEIHQLLLQPFSEACEGLDRAVRDLALATGKEVDFVVEAGEVAVDRSILQSLRDPLLHLVRNAIDHGIETPSERQANGKPRRGRIVVRTLLKGSEVEVAVEDDGRGIVLDAVADAARRRSLSVPEDTAEATRLIFRPGFSTVSNVSEVSGRGVGLDVVKSRIRGMGGSVDVSSRPGAGTLFVLRLPLTLTRTRAVVVRTAGQIFAIPVAGVEALLLHDSSDVRLVDGRPMLLVDNRPVPAASLREILGFPRLPSWSEDLKTPYVVLRDGDERAAFAVDEFLDEQEVVVKKLGARLPDVPYASGATIAAEGRIALILSPAALVRGIGRDDRGSPVPGTPPPPETGRRRVLVVDDSLTARTLERNILEAAGYDVATAVDGAEAWRMLLQHSFDLVVADLDMPGMDGLELTRTVRANVQLAAVPVLIVTGRENPEDRKQAMQAGADAYLPKSTFDDTALLDAVTRLI